MTPLDGQTKALLGKLASYLAGRPGKDEQALGLKLREVVKSGQATEGRFTVADLNIVQRNINTQEFMAQVMGDIAHGKPSPATPGADAEAARAQAQADRLKEYQAAVAKVM